MMLKLDRKSDRLKLVLLIASIVVSFAVLTYVSTIYRYGEYECPVHKLTGLQCPGCGGTRMLKSIMRFDIKSAFLFNPYMLVTTPIMSLSISYEAIKYILTGKINKHFDKFLICYAILTMTFGILRNII